MASVGSGRDRSLALSPDTSNCTCRWELRDSGHLTPHRKEGHLSEPFTPIRVFRFCLLWLLAILAVFGTFFLLTDVRAHESITPGRQQSQVDPERFPWIV